MFVNRNRIEESDKEIDISLMEKERFMRENQVTADNKEIMVQFHRDTMETRRKWIADKKPTVTDIMKRFPRFTSTKDAV